MSCLPDWKDVAGYSALGAAGGLVGAGATALLTKSSVVGGMLCGGAFVPVAILTVLTLDDGILAQDRRDGVAWKTCKLALKILAGFAAGLVASAALTTLAGVSLTVGTMALIDLSVTIVGVGLVILLACCCGDEQPASGRPVPQEPPRRASAAYEALGA